LNRHVAVGLLRRPGARAAGAAAGRGVPAGGSGTRRGAGRRGLRIGARQGWDTVRPKQAPASLTVGGRRWTSCARRSKSLASPSFHWNGFGAPGWLARIGPVIVIPAVQPCWNALGFSVAWKDSDSPSSGFRNSNERCVPPESKFSTRCARLTLGMALDRRAQGHRPRMPLRTCQR
jgi:hypothetical protein